MQVYATGFIPYIGKALNFLLLSWMYAYYCFEYVLHLLMLSHMLQVVFTQIILQLPSYGADLLMIVYCISQLLRYKWNFSELGLDKRLDFFESNWAFFAGFGNILFHYELIAS